MKPESLRIGNYVEYDGGIYQMAVISKEGEPGLDTIEFGYGVVTWKDLKPIPITDDWLIKFGFAILPLCNKFYFKIKYKEEIFGCGNFEIWRHELDNTYNCNGGVNTEFKYIHQLQNIYFALTGKELTFNQIIKA